MLAINSTHTKKIVLSLFLRAIAILGTISQANTAGAITFASRPTPSPASNSDSILRASVDFQIVDNQLLVTLTNTSRSDVTKASDILTAVFFDVTSNPKLTPLSASVGEESSILFAPNPATNPAPNGVGGEWAYKNNLATSFGANQGISSVGLGLFKPSDRFPGANLQGTTSPNGIEYSITSARDNPNTGNDKVTGKNALIKNSVSFVLNGLPANFTENDINNVYFQYGSSLSEPRLAGVAAVPQGLELDEPPAYNALILLLIGMLVRGVQKFGRGNPCGYPRVQELAIQNLKSKIKGHLISDN